MEKRREQRNIKNWSEPPREETPAHFERVEDYFCLIPPTVYFLLGIAKAKAKANPKHNKIIDVFFLKFSVK